MTLSTTSSFTSNYVSLCLEGFLFGFYSAIFVIYLQHHGSKERTDNSKNIIFYALCVLYLLSTGVAVCTITIFVIDPGAPNGNRVIYPVYVVETILFGCCDFIAQSILVYRCWIVWNRKLRVVIIPLILAIAFLATWMAGITGQFGQINQSGHWVNTLIITSFVISMTVNALVTGLIVFKIFKIFQEVKATSGKALWGVTSGTKLWSIILIIIESGMVLFSIQLARLVVFIVPNTHAAINAFEFIAAIYHVLNGITPTIILVRVSMGLSFHHETSLVATAESDLRFSPDNPNFSFPETGNISRGNRRVAPDHLNPIAGMGSIKQEREDDETDGSDDSLMWEDEHIESKIAVCTRNEIL